MHVFMMFLFYTQLLNLLLCIYLLGMGLLDPLLFLDLVSFEHPLEASVRRAASPAFPLLERLVGVLWNAVLDSGLLLAPYANVLDRHAPANVRGGGLRGAVINTRARGGGNRRSTIAGTRTCHVTWHPPWHVGWHARTPATLVVKREGRGQRRPSSQPDEVRSSGYERVTVDMRQAE